MGKQQFEYLRSPQPQCFLLGLLVKCVCPAAGTVFLISDTIRVQVLILRHGIITTMALRTLQCQ